jgi:hypothetical protein
MASPNQAWATIGHGKHKTLLRVIMEDPDVMFISGNID